MRPNRYRGCRRAINEIKALTPSIDDLRGVSIDRKCIAARDLLENLRLAAEQLAEEIIGPDPNAYWYLDPRNIRREIAVASNNPDADWERDVSSLCTCEVCKRAARELEITS
jgi:hypothetical protein